MRLGGPRGPQPANISLINRRVSASPRDLAAVAPVPFLHYRAPKDTATTKGLTGSFISAGSVIEESRFYEDDAGTRIPIDLDADVTSGRISRVDIPAPQLDIFCRPFDASFKDRFDPGELESLVHACSIDPEACRISSGDGIVYKTLGKLRRGEQGVSLEELLSEIGMQKSLKHMFLRGFRDRYTRMGLLGIA
jgi:hypothetical protein